MYVCGSSLNSTFSVKNANFLLSAFFELYRKRFRRWNWYADWCREFNIEIYSVSIMLRGTWCIIHCRHRLTTGLCYWKEAECAAGPLEYEMILLRCAAYEGQLATHKFHFFLDIGMAAGHIRRRTFLGTMPCARSPPSRIHPLAGTISINMQKLGIFANISLKWRLDRRKGRPALWVRAPFGILYRRWPLLASQAYTRDILENWNETQHARVSLKIFCVHE